MTTLRERTKAPTPTTCYYSYVYKGVTYSPALQVQSSHSEYMADYVDQNFEARRADGEVFNNPCTYNVVKRAHSPEQASFAYWWAVDPDNKYVMSSGNITDRFLSLQAWSDWSVCTVDESHFDAGDLARQKCLAKVDSTPYEFFEDLMEVGETIRFLQSPLRGIADVAHAFKNKRDRILLGKPDDSKAKALANLWNQYQFAFRPLLHSIMTAAEVLENFESLKRPARRTAHGFGDNYREKVGTHETWSGDRTCSFFKRSKLREHVHASIYYEVSNPLVDWSFALGLRSKDWPKAIWEFMPLSFMVDRLFDLKSMISGLTNLADPSVTFLASSYTAKTTKQVEIQLGSVYSTTNNLIWSLTQLDTLYLENFDYIRTIWAPSVIDTVPQFTPGNLVKDVKSLVDLIAVIISRL